MVGFVEDPGQVGEVVERALSHFDRDQPEVWRDPDLRSLAGRAIAAVMAQFGALARGSLTLEEVSLPPASAELVIAQVRRGITVEQALHTAGLAQSAAWETWLRGLDASALEPELRAQGTARVATEMLQVGNIVGQRISQLHALERERWLGGRAARRARAAIGLLEGGGPADLAQLSSELDYQLRGPHRAVIAWRDTEGPMADPLAEVVRGIVGPAGLVVQLEVHVVWGWGAGALEHGVLADGVRVALGGSHSGAAGFRRSHREARLARHLAEVTPGAAQVTDYRDVALLALITQDAELARDFVEGVLGPLRAAGPRGLRLARTLRVYLEEQASPRRAAHASGLHENTVINHVRSAEELLGRSVEARHPELLVALILAEALQLPKDAEADA